MTTPTEAQRGAIESDHSRILAVAGAGSGKTWTMIHRLRRLLDGGCSPRDIAVVTYTNAAARVIEDRLRGRHVWGDHYFRDGSLDEVWTCDKCGLNSSTAVDEPCPKNIVALGHLGTLHSFCVRHLDTHGEWPTGVRVMDEDESRAEIVGTAKRIALKPTDPITERTYRRDCYAHGVFDYDLLLEAALNLLIDKNMPRRSWRHLFVDEYQDAAEIDATIYQSMSVANRYFTGDPMQAIFGFRGGDVRQIEKLVASPDWEKHELTVNFRSGRQICEAATRLASKSASEGVRKPLSSFLDNESTVGSRSYPAGVSEAVGIAEALQAHIAAGGNPADFAVLTRTNWIAHTIAEVVAANGVPVKTRNFASLPRDWRLARAALEVVARPKSPDSARRYAEVKDPAWAAAMQREAEREQRPFNLGDEPTGDADKMDYELKLLDVSDESRSLIQKRFLELPTTASLVDLAVSLAVEPPTQDEGEGVFVGTIHAAKGNEWHTVVLAGFEDEVIPGRRKKIDIEEERRLAYVGLTRSKVDCRITWAKWRAVQWPTTDVDRTPSRFIEEMLEPVEPSR
jgi:DNA helicase-2/ATP-dependent DNA helicase PcrA